MVVDVAFESIGAAFNCSKKVSIEQEVYPIIWSGEGRGGG